MINANTQQIFEEIAQDATAASVANCIHDNATRDAFIQCAYASMTETFFIFDTVQQFVYELDYREHTSKEQHELRMQAIATLEKSVKQVFSEHNIILAQTVNYRVLFFALGSLQ